MISLVTQTKSTADRAAVGRLCRTLSIGRSSYYRGRCCRTDPDLALRDRIHKLSLSWPSYGYRPKTRALQRMGYQVNHKRVLRLMREDNLLALRRRAFVSTTDSNHDRAVYANLVPALKITGINQLWVSDLTYIRLAREWVYLAVILDAWSRRCIGWALDRTLDASLGPKRPGQRPGIQIGAKGAGASLGPRRAICLQSLCRHPQEGQHQNQHEPARQSL